MMQNTKSKGRFCVFCLINSLLMSYITQLYFKDVTNLSDARYAAAADASLIGFSFDPADSQYIEPAVFSEIKGWISGPRIVGSFGLVSPDELNREIDQYGLELVEVGLDIYGGYARTIHADTIMRIKLSALDQTSLRHFDGDYLLVHADSLFPNWALTRVNRQMMQLLEDACTYTNCIIDIPAEASQIREMVEMLQPTGICIRGGKEIRPGVKEFDALQDMLEALEA